MKIKKFNRERRKEAEKRRETVHMPHLFTGGESKKNRDKRIALLMKQAKSN